MDRDTVSGFEQARLDQQILDIQTVMKTSNGRRFVWRILSYCGIYRDIIGDNSDMLKQIGNREAGLYILGITSDAAEDNVFKMMKESKLDKETEGAYYDNRESNTDTRTYTDTSTGTNTDARAYSNTSGRSGAHSSTFY